MKISQKEEDIAPQILARLEDSVCDYLAYAKDRPIVCEVSGGLDSSFIAALLAKHSSNVSGYMFTYPDSPSHRGSEACAVTLAKECGIKLQLIDPAHLASPELSVLLPYHDEPSGAFWYGTLFGKTMGELWPKNSAIFSGAGSDQLFSRSPDYLIFLLQSGRLKRFWQSFQAGFRKSFSISAELFLSKPLGVFSKK